MELRKGLAYAIGAYLLWGIFPLYFAVLKPAGAAEVLVHRIIWTAACGLVIIAALRRLRGLWAIFADRRVMLTLSLAAVMIAVNWMVYVYGVQNGYVVETSLGYFLNPLLTVLLGVTLLRERLRPLQWAAVGVGIAAGVVLTVDYGRLPWIALTLAVAFGTYGILKKSVPVPAIEGVAVETLILAPIAGLYLAVGYLFWFTGPGGNTFLTVSPWHTILLILAGPVTAIPLVLYAGAARRLPLTVLGLLQYITPVIQFTLGITVFGEAMPPARLAGFAMVWAALALLTFDGLRAAHGRRRVEAEAVPVCP